MPIEMIMKQLLKSITTIIAMRVVNPIEAHVPEASHVEVRLKLVIARQTFQPAVDGSDDPFHGWSMILIEHSQSQNCMCRPEKPTSLMVG